MRSIKVGPSGQRYNLDSGLRQNDGSGAFTICSNILDRTGDNGYKHCHSIHQGTL
jgi:hypothetical protein